MSKYDYIMDIIKDNLSQGTDYAKSIPGRLGVDSSSRFDRFARRHANTPISELENLSHRDYLIDDFKNNFKENWSREDSQLPIMLGIGASITGVGLYNMNKQEEFEDIIADYQSGMGMDEIMNKYPDINEKVLTDLLLMENE